MAEVRGFNDLGTERTVLERVTVDGQVDGRTDGGDRCSWLRRGVGRVSVSM
jgi:hypothetical protein